MAKAGDRYEVLTGNIWGYANRGDLTGVKAALARDVDVDLVNTAGWTAAHAAAAGGHTKVISVLLRAKADINIRDRGGNLPLHEACKNGHAAAARALVAAGANLEDVRLSQTKGSEVRTLVVDAIRAAGRDPDAEQPVGYARAQVKSTAFWGPRRTPISCKLKKQIMQNKRHERSSRHEGGASPADTQADRMPEPGGESLVATYVDTVRQIKGSKLSRGARRAKAAEQQQQQQQQEQNLLLTLAGEAEEGREDEKGREKFQEEGRYDGECATSSFAALAKLMQEHDEEDEEEVSTAEEEGDGDHGAM